MEVPAFRKIKRGGYRGTSWWPDGNVFTDAVTPPRLLVDTGWKWFQHAAALRLPPLAAPDAS